MVALLLLYPTLSAVRLVGTDLVQAVPLVLSAAISHVLVSGVDWAVLIPLIVGGTPGTFLGSKLAHWVSQSVVRRGIVIVLTLTGLGMLGVPPEYVGIIGAGLLILGRSAGASRGRPAGSGLRQPAHARPAPRPRPPRRRVRTARPTAPRRSAARDRADTWRPACTRRPRPGPVTGLTPSGRK